MIHALAASDPLGHVIDAPLGEGFLWAKEGHHASFPIEGAQDFCMTLHGIGLTKHSLLFMVAGLLTLLFFWTYARSAGKKAVPGRWGNFVELVLETLRDQIVRPFMGTHGDRYLPMIATFFVFIAVCNLLGLIPFLDLIGHGGNTATGSLAITAGLAFCAFVLYHTIGVREQGNFFLYIKNLFPHVPLFVLPLMIVIEVVAHIIRPIALAIRLFANMLAGHAMVAAIIGFTTAFGTLGGAAATTGDEVLGGGIAFVSVLAVTALTFLELLVAIIQAFVFTFLTTVFLSMAVHPDH